MIHDGLYTVESRREDSIRVKLSDENHAVFKAHFPSNPILPGFMHLEIIADIFSIKITAIKKAKFSEIVCPNEVLLYVKKENKIQVLCREKEVANFIL